MQQPNQYGVYRAETIEELARIGRAFAAIEFCQCEDGLYRYSLQLQYSYGGFGGPICASTEGFATQAAAKEAGVAELLRRFPEGWASDPQSVHDELRYMRAKIESDFRQPTLF